MQNTKIKALARVQVGALSKFLVISGVAILIPFYIHIQWLTGPIVNALLILSLFLIGIRSAVFIAPIPSVVALSVGLLPAILAPMVPFIMISNILFVLVIDYVANALENKNFSYWIAILIASTLKFAFLLFSVNIIAGLLLKSELSLKVAEILSWPQFYTALLGGIIAFPIIKIFKFKIK